MEGSFALFTSFTKWEQPKKEITTPRTTEVEDSATETSFEIAILENEWLLILAK
jgi:hypothetical protein